MRVALLAVALLALPLAGCLAPAALESASLVPATGFDTSRGWSMPLSPALYAILEGAETLVPSHDGTKISMAVFLPEIEGCDWGDATADGEPLPEACRVPAVMDAGPYYANAIDRQKFRPPLVEWLVPRGYAVAYMSVRGTGESHGCMELFSLNEQKDVSEMVTWLATRPWSTGNVGMMGRSYDGTTPLMAAAQGNPHLKTIVPISSVADLSNMMFKNGTSEFRGPIFHNVVYWASFGMGVGLNSEPHRRDHWGEQACEAVVEGTTVPTRTALTGDTDDPYWEERDLWDDVLANYDGSVWFVHGLEDWNVNPSQVVPYYQQMQDAGIPAKMWLGVWGHAYPDRSDEHRNVRWDWADQTVKWFDFWLKGVGEQPSLDVEVEDSLFVWRREATYPPRDATFAEFEIGAGALAAVGNASAGRYILATTPASWKGGLGQPDAGQVGEWPVGGDSFTVDSEPLAGDLRIAGLPQVHVAVTPTTAAGAHLFAELYDVYPDGRAVRIGWGAMNLRYHAGGNEGMPTLTPGQTVTALMEMEPVDAHVGVGHKLRLVLHRDGVEDVLPGPNADPVVLELGAASLLRLPAIERADLVPSYAAPGLEG